MSNSRRRILSSYIYRNTNYPEHRLPTYINRVLFPKLLLLSNLLLCLMISLPAQAAAGESEGNAEKRGDWISFAIELTSASEFGGKGTVHGALARSKIRTEAEAEALKACRSSSKNPGNCRTLDTFNSGCKYLSLGTTPWEQPGWGAGPTPQAAYDKCRSLDLNCQTPEGTCADALDEESGTNITRAPPIRYWVALSAATGKFGSSYYAVTASGVGPTEDYAKRMAVFACNKHRDQVSNLDCRAVVAFNKGCGFIARAYANPLGGPLGWNMGRTRQQAYDRCTNAGYQCLTETLGRCIEE